MGRLTLPFLLPRCIGIPSLSAAFGNYALSFIDLTLVYASVAVSPRPQKCVGDHALRWLVRDPASVEGLDLRVGSAFEQALSCVAIQSTRLCERDA